MVKKLRKPKDIDTCYLFVVNDEDKCIAVGDWEEACNIAKEGCQEDQCDYFIVKAVAKTEYIPEKIDLVSL